MFISGCWCPIGKGVVFWWWICCECLGIFNGGINGCPVFYRTSILFLSVNRFLTLIFGLSGLSLFIILPYSLSSQLPFWLSFGLFDELIVTCVFFSNGVDCSFVGELNKFLFYSNGVSDCLFANMAANGLDVPCSGLLPCVPICPISIICPKGVICWKKLKFFFFLFCSR